MFGGFGRFWSVWRVLERLRCWQTAALNANRKPLLWPWRVWRVLKGVEGLEGFGRFGGFGRFWRVWCLEVLEGFGWCLEGLEDFGAFGGFGVFGGWQTAILKANRKPLLWPWPWGA